MIERFSYDLHGVAPRDSTITGSIHGLETPGTLKNRIGWRFAGKSIELVLDVKVSPVLSTTPAPSPLGREIPVLVATFISRSVQAQLEKDGRSYWDATGNFLLQNRDPFLWVRMLGSAKNPNPDITATGLRSLKGRSASEVVVYLLANGRTSSVRDLSRESGVSLGTVSRTVALLRDDGLLEQTSDGAIVVSDPLTLAERWAREYSFEKTFKAKRYFSILGSATAFARIRESGVAYAVTGLAAQALWYEENARVTPLPNSELWLYADDVDQIVNIGDLIPDNNGTIMVAVTDFLDQGREGYRNVGDIRSVWPWRAAGDLMSLSGRYAAAGTEFAKELIGNATQVHDRT